MVVIPRIYWIENRLTDSISFPDISGKARRVDHPSPE